MIALAVVLPLLLLFLLVWKVGIGLFIARLKGYFASIIIIDVIIGVIIDVIIDVIIAGIWDIG